MLASAIVLSVSILAVAHVCCDVYGMPLGTQLRYLFKPAVRAIYWLTFKRVDLGKCAGCKEREAYLNRMFGDNK